MEKSDTPNDYVSEMYEYIDILSMEDGVGLLEACERFKVKSTKAFRLKEEDVNVKAIRESFKIKGEREMVAAITELIKFEFW